VRVLILSLNVDLVGEVGALREQVDLKRAPPPVRDGRAVTAIRTRVLKDRLLRIV
jgi:hypothetical protein